MKRHEALIPLSREHHQNLILAQSLKSSVKDYKGMPTTPEEKAKMALNEFNNGIRKHFDNEEVILKSLEHYPELSSITEEILSEHTALTKMFLALDNEYVTDEQLDLLGRSLYDHIRKEDRVLFPLIESLCTSEEFQKISDMW